MKKKNLKIGVMITVALLTVAAAGMTISRLQSRSNLLTNTFKVGDVTTEIEEEGEGTVKKSRIKNIGKNDCIVRARVTVSPAEAASAIELTGKGEDWDWSRWANGDGCIYYTKVLPAGENSYTGYLFEGVTLKTGIDWKKLGVDGFDITIYEESVQVEVYDSESETMISALDENGVYHTEKADRVWAVYENAER